MFSVSKHMLRSKGVRNTYYNKNLVLDTNNIIHKKFFRRDVGPVNLRFKNNPRSNVSFYNELEVLQLLEKNFINTPKIDHYPFPKVISYNDKPDSKQFIISMTFCGINAIENACLYSEKKNIKPVNVKNTIQCILNNFKHNLIRYRDWKADNVCINEIGQISLIDFGKWNYESLEKLEKRYQKPDFNALEESLYSYLECTESDFIMEKALGRDKEDKCKWKNRVLRGPWNMLYYF